MPTSAGIAAAEPVSHARDPWAARRGAAARVRDDSPGSSQHAPALQRDNAWVLILRQAVREVRAIVVMVLCLSIRVYQWLLSPLLGNCCRFEPSCSRYALLCIERLGPLRGSWLSLRRVLRCHPFCPGGHDPPPEVTS